MTGCWSAPTGPRRARQRSLDAAVDWSYQLLTGPEQRVFRRLAVFPGPFSLDAAEAVAGADAGPAVLHLVDCSLLVPPAAGPDGRSRYSMLETLRGYGLRQLGQAGEEPEAAAALAAHALSMAERAVDQLARRDQELSAARWLDAEDAAVHQGLAWALDHDPPSALRLALALAPWWLVRGRWVQGYALLQRAAGQADPGDDAWCAAQVWLGRLARGASDFVSVVLGHNSAVVTALKDGPPSSGLVDGLVGRAAALRNMGQLDEAAAEARTALDLARRIGYAEGEARALVNSAISRRTPARAKRPWHGPGRRGRYPVTGFPPGSPAVSIPPWPGPWCATGNWTACRSCAISAWPRPGPRAT